MICIDVLSSDSLLLFILRMMISGFKRLEFLFGWFTVASVNNESTDPFKIPCQKLAPLCTSALSRPLSCDFEHYLRGCYEVMQSGAWRTAALGNPSSSIFRRPIQDAEAQGIHTQGKTPVTSHVKDITIWVTRECCQKNQGKRLFLGGDAEELDFLGDEGREKSEIPFILQTEFIAHLNQIQFTSGMGKKDRIVQTSRIPGNKRRPPRISITENVQVQQDERQSRHWNTGWQLRRTLSKHIFDGQIGMVSAVEQRSMRQLNIQYTKCSPYTPNNYQPSWVCCYCPVILATHYLEG